MRYTLLLGSVVLLALIHESEAWGWRAPRIRIPVPRIRLPRIRIPRIRIPRIRLPIIGGWGDWGPWQLFEECNESCGGGKQKNVRERECNNPIPQFGGLFCRGSNVEYQTVTCNNEPCPTEIPKVDGKWSRWEAWSDYTACTKSCGGGVHEKTRTRSCNNPKPAHGGSDCLGPSSNSHTSNCNEQDCPEPAVDGGWSDWSLWNVDSSCTKPCGGGSQENTRQRTCDKPEPSNGGRDCDGDDSEFQTVSCNQQQCQADVAKVNGGWTEWDPWSDYGECTKTCGGGVQERTRSRNCTNPKPAHGGRDCPGRSSYSDTSPCNEQQCTGDVECPPGKIFYRAGQTCGHYVQCVNGVAYRNTCPPGTVWDEKIQGCNHGSC